MPLTCSIGINGLITKEANIGRLLKAGTLFKSLKESVAITEICGRGPAGCTDSTESICPRLDQA